MIGTNILASHPIGSYLSSLPVVVVPATASLSSSAFASVVSINVITETTLLTLNSFSPKVNTAVTPDTLETVTASFSPTPKTNTIIVPDTQTFTFDLFSPSLAHNIVVDALTAILTTADPTVKISLDVVPGTESLVVSVFAPTSQLGQLIVPNTATTTSTTSAPLVNLTVIPSVSSVTVTTFSPNTVSSSQLVPETQTLLLDSFSPVLAEKVISEVQTLALTSLTPFVVLGQEIIPNTQTIEVSTFSPLSSVSDNIVASPSPADLSLTVFPSGVEVALVVPTQSLVLTQHSPSLGDYIITFVTPVTITTFVPTLGIRVIPSTYSFNTATNSVLLASSILLNHAAVITSGTSAVLATSVYPETSSPNLTVFTPDAVMTENEIVQTSETLLQLVSHALALGLSIEPNTTSLATEPSSPLIGVSLITPLNSVSLVTEPPQLGFGILTLTGAPAIVQFSPNVAITDNAFVVPNLTSLQLDGLASVLTTGITTGVTNLAILGESPSLGLATVPDSSELSLITSPAVLSFTINTDVVQVIVGVFPPTLPTVGSPNVNALTLMSFAPQVRIAPYFASLFVHREASLLFAVSDGATSVFVADTE